MREEYASLGDEAATRAECADDESVRRADADEGIDGMVDDGTLGEALAVVDARDERIC